MTKTIRIWDGCKVVALITVRPDGMTAQGAVGGAGNSSKPDIELDPWAGLLVDHGLRSSPIAWRDVERELDAALGAARGEDDGA
jgi:hypothetical protein